MTTPSFSVVRRISRDVKNDARSRSLEGWATLAVVATLLAGCANLSFLRNDPVATPVPKASINGTEIATPSAKPIGIAVRTNPKLAKAAAKENNRIIAAYGGVYSNRRVENQLATIVSKLVAKSDVPSQGFQITILNSPSVNAFALPGGLLYITRGLLALANDASEVAAVLAHEMAHVTSQHGQERLRLARQTQIVSEAVKGVISDPNTAAAIRQQRRLDFATFTQNQEIEADIVGVRNAGLAGYDPFAAARFLKIMANYQNYRTAATVAKTNDGPNFLSTHPSTPARIQRAILAARQFGAPGVGRQDKEAYLLSVDGMIFGDDPAEGFVRDRAFFHPQLRFTFSVPTGFVIENTKEAVLATARNGDAVRFDSVDVPGVLSLTDYIQSGWLNGLDPRTIRTFKVNGADAASATAQVNEWNFKITVIRAATSTYRMIFATKSPTTTFDRAVSSTVSSFRTLTQREANSLSPLRLRLVRIKAGDTAFSLSRQMRGLVSNPAEALRALNGLDKGQEPKPGDFAKIVVDDRTG